MLNTEKVQIVLDQMLFRPGISVTVRSKTADYGSMPSPRYDRLVR